MLTDQLLLGRGQELGPRLKRVGALVGRVQGQVRASGHCRHQPWQPYRAGPVTGKHRGNRQVRQETQPLPAGRWGRTGVGFQCTKYCGTFKSNSAQWRDMANVTIYLDLKCSFSSLEIFHYDIPSLLLMRRNNNIFGPLSINISMCGCINTPAPWTSTSQYFSYLFDMLA